MAKKKTSSKQERLYDNYKIYNAKYELFEGPDPIDFFLKEGNLNEAILECAEKKDFEGVIEIIEIYLHALKVAQDQKRIKNIDDYYGPLIKAFSHVLPVATR